MRRLLASLASLALLVTLLPAPALAAAPSNDNLADAIALTGTSGSVTGTNVEATLETGETYSWNASVWYRWSNTGRKDLVAMFSTCGGATFDTTLSVFSAEVAAPTFADLTGVTNNDDACGLQSRVAFTAQAGASYWIRLGSFSSGTGGFTLAWIAQPPISGTLSLTLTNTPQDPLNCTLTVKGTNLLEGQDSSLIKGESMVGVSTLAGRWTAEPVLLDKTLWGVAAPGDLYMDPSTLVSADGLSIVTPKIVNRCK